MTGKNVPADEYVGDNFLEDVFFPDVEAAIARRESAVKRKSHHSAHSKLKSDGVKAFALWKRRTGNDGFYVPYFVGKAWLGEGRVKRMVYIGKKGVCDGFFATCGTTLAAEAKTGTGALESDQVEFRRRWLLTGNPFVEYHTPQQLVDALDQIAAQRGRGPFG